VQPLVFHFLQDLDHIVDPVDSQIAFHVQRDGFAAGIRPAHAGRTGRQEPFSFPQGGFGVHFLQAGQDLRIQVGDGDHAVDRAGGAGDRVDHGGAFCRAGADEENSDFLLGKACFFRQLAPGQVSGHFHRRIKRHQVVNQAREAHLDQPDNNRAGR